MSACEVCSGSDCRPLYAGILRCADCTHAFADLEIGDEELRRLYGRGYFFGEEYADYLADAPLARRNFSLRLRVLRRFLDAGRHRRLFEIGCAYGLFLDLARDGFGSVAGIDVSADAAQYARSVFGLDVQVGDLLDLDLGAREFDVACLWDTIEHLRRPRATLAKTVEHMPPGALLAFTTGDIGSVVARWSGPRWRLIHPPTHLHYFTRRSMRRMVSDLGCDVVYDRSCGFHRSLDLAAYRLIALGYNRPAWYQFIKRLGIAKLSFYSNLGDIRYVIARRR